VWRVCEVECSHESIISADKYHPTLDIKLPNYQSVPSCVRYQTYINFRKVDYPKICPFISLYNWRLFFLSLDLELATNSFFDALHVLYPIIVPKYVFCIYLESSNSSWVFEELKHILFFKRKYNLNLKRLLI